MDTAINATTKQIVVATFLESDSSYLDIAQEKWYINPSEVESFDNTKVQDISTIEVKWKKGTLDIINFKGTQYNRAPCFWIPNKEELGINVIPESREHKEIKTWIYNRIIQKNLKFKYSKVTKPYNYSNIITLNDFAIDYSKIGIEYTIINNTYQRADIIIPFKHRDKLFGCGIVIEIQLSKQHDNTTTDRTTDYGLKGYSLCWLWRKDFAALNYLEGVDREEFIDVKTSELDLLPMGIILDEHNDKLLKDIRLESQNLSRMLDIKLEEIQLATTEWKAAHTPIVLEDKCSSCGGDLFYKTGKYGEYYQCNICKHSVSIGKKV